MAACFECLERRIRADFPDGGGVAFVHGVCDSHLPFASAAVVQIMLDGSEESTVSHHTSGYFVLVALRVGKMILDTRSENNSLRNGMPIVVHVENSYLSQQCQYRRELDASISSDKILSSTQIDSFNGRESSIGHGSSSFSFCKKQSCISTITELTPVSYVGKGSYATIRELISSYYRWSIEDHVILSLNALAENKISGSSGVDFLNFVGFSAFDGISSSVRVRHPNILHILGVLETPGYCYVLHPKAPYTLENILHYSPKALLSDWHIRFLIYQIISALAYLHDLGVFHGNLSPSTVLLTDSFWPCLNISDICLVKSHLGFAEPACSRPNSYCCMEDCSCGALYADCKLSLSVDWQSHFKRWWAGELSNYEYLLILNKLAGRRWGDPTFHTVMPWVIDFRVKPHENSEAGWRDLTKSKWRLAKGDEQLDFTFSSSEIPHHVSDECLSELAVCSYKARRLPKTILRSAVRSVYEPNEYPSSMQRLYQWTPDECIPEFYSDPQIFVSLHSEMSDLALPSWVTSREEFIHLHRDALESSRVSQQLHHWIDITFGYKLSGQASVEAKNVMLPSSDPSRPKSIGRRQLFTKPHPLRRGSTSRSFYHNKRESCVSCEDKASQSNANTNMMLESLLEDLEQATLFTEHERHLNPIYSCDDTAAGCHSSFMFPQSDCTKHEISQTDSVLSVSSDFDFSSVLECFEADDNASMRFQELLRWKQMSSLGTEHNANDIFSIGCMLAELYLHRPLFDPVSLAAYKENGIIPGALQELPSHVALLVESCIHREWNRRPSAKHLLESQYFPPSLRSAYMFLAPLQLVCKSEYRLKYVAKLANGGALKAMGAFAAEMCAPYCLPIIASPLSDVETESALCLLKEFLKCLNIQATKALVLPIIQKILQTSEYSHLKVSLLQDSFVRELWKKLGKQTYIEKVHPLVISNLCNSSNKITASAASVLLIGSAEELGIPITVHQTVLPLIHSFGKGLCADGIDALVRIGGLFGESFIVKQILPLLRNVTLSSIDSSKMNRPEPQHSWNSFALIDSLSTLDGLVSVLPVKVVLREFIQDQVCLHMKVLMQVHLDLRVIQVAATALIALCEKIGPQYTAMHVLPQLKELFAQLAFPQAASGVNLPGKSFDSFKLDQNEHIKIESRMDLVFLLYPFLASLVGIEKLRECCSTWFLLEQTLQKFYSGKWGSFGESSRSAETMKTQRLQLVKYTSSEHNPAKLLLYGTGWSVPQPQGVKNVTNLTAPKKGSGLEQVRTVENLVASDSANHPWFWFPSPDASWEAPDFLGRGGGMKDELPWKIKASVLYSARAHPGALRSLAICQDECTIFTGGVGPGFKGSIQRWELPNMNCTSGYYGHDEVVNAICMLSVTRRIASCDGTIHVWNENTGKLIAVYAESSTSSPLQTAAKVSTDQMNMLMQDALSAGILSNAFSGSLYTCMHYLESEDKLVAGMGNGSIRFIDILRDQKLHLWKSDSAEYSFSSLVSAICSCGSDKLGEESTAASSSWIAAGLSSGHCRLLDERSGNIIAVWRAHDGYITKLAAPEDHLLVSSSLDKTLRVWDLRRNPANQLNVFRSHSDGISSFAVWGQDVISVSRNKIALTSLSRSTNEVGHRQLLPQNLYSADRGMKNLSVLSTITVLPFSRLFLVGTEDGFLKICC